VLADLVTASGGVSQVRAWATDVALVVGGAAWVAVLGQIAVPLGFTPIPLSLGTLAVLSAGSALGAKRGAAALGLFLVAGAAGLPVFAGHHSGLGLPTLGYVLGYVAAASFAGWAAARGTDRSYWRTLIVMVGASALIYAVGVPYLAVAMHLTLAQAMMQGLVPFLVGDLVKAALAAAVGPVAWGLVKWAGRDRREPRAEGR
jgi:biotin transport system substrate-specific component